MLKTVSTYINVIGAFVYKGTWNAATNSPTLTSSVGDKGDYYVVSQAGSTNLNGITDWQVNDIAVFNGAVWQKIDNTDAVLSVNGQIGAVVLTAPDVGATPNTAYVLASGLLTGGGQLTGNVTVSLTSVPAANVSGLGTMSTQNANNVAITGGNVSSVIIDGGTYANANITSVVATFPNNYLANSSTTLGNATLTLGGTTASVGNLTLANATISSGTVTANVTSNNVNLTGTTSATATFATSELPLVPEGYLTIQIGGVNKKIPYYGV